MTEQQPNVPPPPPMQPSRRRWLPWVLVGAGGCLMLIFLVFFGFAGCLAFIAGSGGGGSGSGGGNGEGDDYATAKKDAVPIGETTSAGNVAWTVLSVQQATELKSFGQQKHGNFIIVNLTFKNNGKEAVTLDSASLAIIDDKGRVNETDPDASMYVPANQDLFLNQVNPGVTKRGQAIFDVAPGASGFILRCGDTNPFGGTNTYVDLST